MVNVIVQEIKHLASSEGLNRMLICNIHVRLISEVLMTSSLQHQIGTRTREIGGDAVVGLNPLGEGPCLNVDIIILIVLCTRISLL